MAPPAHPSPMYPYPRGPAESRSLASATTSTFALITPAIMQAYVNPQRQHARLLPQIRKPLCDVHEHARIPESATLRIRMSEGSDISGGASMVGDADVSLVLCASVGA